VVAECDDQTTTTESNKKPTHNDSKEIPNNLWIIGVVLGLVAAVIFILIFCFIVKP